MDPVKLAKLLCKMEIDWDHNDSPDVIWSQMRASVQEAFLSRAVWLVAQMQKEGG